MNPLLNTAGLPPFSAIKASHVEEAVDIILAENVRAIEALITKQQSPTWESFMLPLETLNDRLDRVCAAFRHLNAVMNSEELRRAYQNAIKKITEYSTNLSQDERLYRAVLTISKASNLNEVQQKILSDEIRDFRLSGIELEQSKKDRLKMLENTMAELTTKFEENVLLATDGWSYLISDIQDLKGVPEHAIQAARERAEQNQQTGYRLNLEFPCYFPIMCYCDNREIRREMYMAYVTRASDQGPQAKKWDNSEIMASIVNLRREKAQLLGFENYAQYSLATKMAKKTEDVLHFLRDLAKKARKQGQAEWKALEDFAREKYHHTKLEPWDVNYFREKLRLDQYEISEEEVRPYFPSEKVIAGLFLVVEKLFNIKITETSGVDIWHPDVKFYSVYDASMKLRAHFYFDLYARPNKRSGAWMDECRIRWRDADGVMQIPVTYLTCNFAGPVGGKSALWSHDEVITLFHEFGHGLQHMLTQIDYPEVSGINGVCWDAVELPSQFLENWCWEREALDLISSHFETHEPIPKSLLTRMLNAKNFQSASAMLRQIEFSLFDFELHSKSEKDLTAKDIHACLTAVREEVSVVPVWEFNRFEHSFTHIFSGGYGAGYYSYYWAEVLASDAFSRFEQEGIFNPKTGQDFCRHILEKGGAYEPMELFRAFRGRDPEIEPLLRHHGIV